ncbi:MAG: ATP F0F1 synthase subunit B [Limibacillus sp.]
MFSTPEFWIALSLVIFLGLAVWKGMGPALKSLDDRAAKIKQELDEARTLREEAQHMLAEYKRKQRDALGEAEQIVEHAKQEAERMQTRAHEELEEQLKRREQQAMDRSPRPSRPPCAKFAVRPLTSPSPPRPSWSRRR